MTATEVLQRCFKGLPEAFEKPLKGFVKGMLKTITSPLEGLSSGFNTLTRPKSGLYFSKRSPVTSGQSQGKSPGMQSIRELGTDSPTLGESHDDRIAFLVESLNLPSLAPSMPGAPSKDGARVGGT